MARITPAPPEKFADVSDHMERWKKLKGYPPNSWLTMVRKPKVFRAYRELHTAVMIDEGELPKALKFMIAEVVSMAAGDPYCAAHNAENAVEVGGLDTAESGSARAVSRRARYLRRPSAPRSSLRAPQAVRRRR